MNSNYSAIKTANKTYSFLIIGFLLIAAFTVRMHNLTKPPLDFAPIRQLNAAHFVRAEFYKTSTSVPQWKKDFAKENLELMVFTGEPRIMENLTLLGYRLLEKEALWIPRLLSSIFWVSGGLFMFLVARRLSSEYAALFSTAFFLFLPYSISSSRSFQPESLMVMSTLICFNLMLNYYDSPSARKLIATAAMAAFAMFVKPYCVFSIFSVFFFLNLYHNGIKKAFLGSHMILFSAISLFPTFLYYGYGMIQSGDLQDHVQSSFLPHLLTEPYFWSDWLMMIGRTVGYIFFASGLAGLFFMFKGRGRVVIGALWLAYLCYGIFATYHIHTHDYYQVLFIPLIALSAGPILQKVVSVFWKGFTVHRKIYLILLILILAFTGLGLNNSQLRDKLTDNKSIIRSAGLFIGVNPQFNEFLRNNFEENVKIAEEIGSIVNHNKNLLFLSDLYGRFLTYYGFMSGLPWYNSDSIRELSERGISHPTSSAQFNNCFLNVRTNKRTKTKYLQYQPDFIVITDFEEFQRQADFRIFLKETFPVYANSENYIIYDTRSMPENCTN